MTSRILPIVFCLTATVSILSSAIAAQTNETDAGSWSLAADGRIGPLENFPKGGLSMNGMHHFVERIRLGGRLTYYFPRGYGNVMRNAAVLEVLLQGIVLDTRYIDWYLSLGVGIGFFHDDYRRVYDDVTRLAPGFTVDTGMEIRATSVVRPFLSVGEVMYFPKDITDSKWMEISIGVRLIF